MVLYGNVWGIDFKGKSWCEWFVWDRCWNCPYRKYKNQRASLFRIIFRLPATSFSLEILDELLPAPIRVPRFLPSAPLSSSLIFSSCSSQAVRIFLTSSSSYAWSYLLCWCGGRGSWGCEVTLICVRGRKSSSSVCDSGCCWLSWNFIRMSRLFYWSSSKSKPIIFSQL